MTVVTWIISSCVLILAVIGIRAVLGKKMRPGLRYALWGIVLLRLLFPGVVFSSPISVQNITQQASTAIEETVRAEKARTEAPIIETVEYETGQTTVATPVYESVEYPANATPETPASNTAAVEHTATVAPTAPPTIPSGRAPEEAPEAEPEVIEEAKPAIEVTDVLIAVWIAGTGVAIVLFVISNLRFYLKLRRRRRPISIECPLRVYAVENLSSSCLFGNGIYISAETAEDAVKFRHVLAHELSHHRHGDHVWTLLRSFALAIHWYNPLVWWAAALARHDSELCADAGALKRIGEAERTRYGATLIELSAKRASKVSLLCTATTMTNGKSALKERVTMIAKRPRMTVAVVLAVAILASIVTGCVFTGASAASISEETAETEENESAEPEATDGEESGEFIIDAETGTVKGFTNENVTRLVIPEEINGVTVTAIEEFAFIYFNNLESVMIPASLKETTAGAFDYCPSLTEINVSEDNDVYASSDGVLYSKDMKTLVRCPSGRSGEFVVPDHVTAIGEWAFVTCDQLESVTIPTSVTGIGSNAFCYCSSLTEINVAEGNGVYTSSNGVLYTKDMKTLVCCPSGNSGEYTITEDVTSIGTWAFAYNDLLNSVIIPDGVEEISDYAFTYVKNLKSVTIPNSVISIGNWAFWGCDVLADVYYGGTEAEWKAITTGLGNDCLLNATVHLPGEESGECVINDEETAETETEPEESAEQEEFADWEKVKNYRFDANTGRTTVFVGRNVRKLIIPDDIDGVAVKTVDNSSPSDKLESILLPASMTKLDENAFRYCPNLTELNVSKDNEVYTSIDGVLYTKDKKTLVRCPSGRSGEFIVPDHVTSIAYWAFFTCNQLKSVTIPASVTEIDEDAFSQCTSLTEIKVAEDNEVYASLNGVLYTKDMKTLVCCPNGKMGDLRIPDQVKTIGKYAFCFCESLNSVIIPEGVTKIDEIAFNFNTHLKIITIPKSVISIGNWAFQGCENLTFVDFGGTEAEWKAIETGIENDCLLNATVRFAGEEL